MTGQDPEDHIEDTKEDQEPDQEADRTEDLLKNVSGMDKEEPLNETSPDF